MQTAKKSWWAIPYQFALETLAGSAMFLVIALAAVGLSLVVDYLEARNLAGVLIVSGLRVAEYSLFLLDLIMYSRYLWRAGVRTWKEFE